MAEAALPAPLPATLYGTEYGTDLPADAERIVFLHGLFGQGRNWTSVAKALADGFRVLLLDLPDHGRSPWTRAVSYPGMAAAVAAELQARAPGARWTVVGHSMGGKVAMALALARPEMVARLVVVDMSPVSYERLGQESYVAAMRTIDLQTLAERGAAESALAQQIADPSIVGFLLQNLRRTRGPGGTQHWGWQFNLDLLGHGLRALADWPEVEGRHYVGPTLWVAGADSDYITRAYADPMRALFPQTRLVTIKNAAHWVHADQPAIFVQTLRAFVTGTPLDARH